MVRLGESAYFRALGSCKAVIPLRLGVVAPAGDGKAGCCYGRIAERIASLIHTGAGSAVLFDHAGVSIVAVKL